MTNTNKSAPVVDRSTEILAIGSTSGKIRFMSSLGMSTAQIEKNLKTLGVTTKDGNPIRYQHVRNVLMTILTTK